MIRMEISLTGVKELNANLDRISDVISDFSPELRDIGEWYLQFLQNDVFSSGGSAYGEPWAALSAKYDMAKSKKYPGRGVLEASGKMRTSWKLYTSSHYALIENTTDYAIYHQEGTSRLPQRTIVKLDQQRQDTIMDMFKEGVLKRIQDAFNR